MAWQSLCLRLPREHADAFSDALLELGAICVNVDDAFEGTRDEKPVFGEPGADRSGDIVLVKGSNGSKMSRVVAALQRLNGDKNA